MLKSQYPQRVCRTAHECSFEHQPSVFWGGANLVFGVAVVACVSGRQCGDERLLRHLDMAEHLHTLLAGLLLFEQLALTGNIAAITLGEHVLAQCANVLTCDNAGADGG